MMSASTMGPDANGLFSDDRQQRRFPGRQPVHLDRCAHPRRGGSWSNDLSGGHRQLTATFKTIPSGLNSCPLPKPGARQADERAGAELRLLAAQLRPKCGAYRSMGGWSWVRGRGRWQGAFARSESSKSEARNKFEWPKGRISKQINRRVAMGQSPPPRFSIALSSFHLIRFRYSEFAGFPWDSDCHGRRAVRHAPFMIGVIAASPPWRCSVADTKGSVHDHAVHRGAEVSANGPRHRRGANQEPTRPIFGSAKST